MKKSKKKYWEMTSAELTEATKEFDREFVADTFHPLSPENRARWERAKRKPKSGIAGVKTIAVSVDKTLLKRTENLAKKKGLTRDALFDHALKTVLAADRQRA